jgi:hypothetical protein
VAEPKKKNRAPKEASRPREIYSGRLAKLPQVYPAFFDPESPPLAVGRLMVAIEESTGQPCNLVKTWKSMVLEARKELEVEFGECVDLLCQHYGIDRRKREAGWLLALALARDHVPAFQIELAAEKTKARKAKKKSTFDEEKSVQLFFYWWLKERQKEHKLTTGEVESLKTLEEAIGLPATKETVRKLCRQMGEAQHAYWSGTATDFQTQFVEKVEPRLVEMLRR